MPHRLRKLLSVASVAACSLLPRAGRPASADAPFVPAWAQGVVWYEITPETFWNGDRSSDRFELRPPRIGRRGRERKVGRSEAHVRTLRTQV